MVSKRRLLAFVLIGTGVMFAACSLITDVDRSKIEDNAAGGTSSIDSGSETGGQSATGTGGGTSKDGGTQVDASVPNSGEEDEP